MIYWICGLLIANNTTELQGIIMLHIYTSRTLTVIMFMTSCYFFLPVARNYKETPGIKSRWYSRIHILFILFKKEYLSVKHWTIVKSIRCKWYRLSLVEATTLYLFYVDSCWFERKFGVGYHQFESLWIRKWPYKFL